MPLTKNTIIVKLTDYQYKKRKSRKSRKKLERKIQLSKK